MLPLEVILDAATLFPASLRDILLRLAEAKFYKVRWTNEILEETRRNLVAKGKMSEEQAQHLFEEIGIAFPEAIVAKTDYENTINLMKNHSGDRHVLAAAVACKAQVIVTPNLRHFPKVILEPLSVEAQSPDEFLRYRFELNPELMVQTIEQQANGLKRFARSRADVLNALEKHASNTVREIRLYLQNDS